MFQLMYLDGGRLHGVPDGIRVNGGCSQGRPVIARRPWCSTPVSSVFLLRDYVKERNIARLGMYTMSQKNDTDVAHYNFNAH